MCVCVCVCVRLLVAPLVNGLLWCWWHNKWRFKSVSLFKTLFSLDIDILEISPGTVHATLQQGHLPSWRALELTADQLYTQAQSQANVCARKGKPLAVWTTHATLQQGHLPSWRALELTVDQIYAQAQSQANVCARKSKSLAVCMKSATPAHNQGGLCFGPEGTVMTRASDAAAAAGHLCWIPEIKTGLLVIYLYEHGPISHLPLGTALLTIFMITALLVIYEPSPVGHLSLWTQLH